jgi:hypothetical protein
MTEVVVNEAGINDVSGKVGIVTGNARGLPRCQKERPTFNDHQEVPVVSGKR